MKKKIRKMGPGFIVLWAFFMSGSALAITVIPGDNYVNYPSLQPSDVRACSAGSGAAIVNCQPDPNLKQGYGYCCMGGKPGCSTNPKHQGLWLRKNKKWNYTWNSVQWYWSLCRNIYVNNAEIADVACTIRIPKGGCPFLDKGARTSIVTNTKTKLVTGTYSVNNLAKREGNPPFVNAGGMSGGEIFDPDATGEDLAIDIDQAYNLTDTTGNLWYTPLDPLAAGYPQGTSNYPHNGSVYYANKQNFLTIFGPVGTKDVSGCKKPGVDQASIPHCKYTHEYYRMWKDGAFEKAMQEFGMIPIAPAKIIDTSNQNSVFEFLINAKGVVTFEAKACQGKTTPTERAACCTEQKTFWQDFCSLNVVKVNKAYGRVKGLLPYDPNDYTGMTVTPVGDTRTIEAISGK